MSAVMHDPQRQALDEQLQVREAALRRSVFELRGALAQVLQPSNLLRRAFPLLPYVAVAAVAGVLLLRLRRHGLQPMLLLSAGLHLWRSWSAARGASATPSPSFPAGSRT